MDKQALAEWLDGYRRISPLVDRPRTDIPEWLKRSRLDQRRVAVKGLN